MKAGRCSIPAHNFGVELFPSLVAIQGWSQASSQQIRAFSHHETDVMYLFIELDSSECSKMSLSYMIGSPSPPKHC